MLAARPVPQGRAAGGVRVAPSSRPVAKAKPGARAATGPSRLLVASKLAEDDDEIGMDTLVGEYAEKGVNHNRKVYQKTDQIEGHENMSVFLYYWDSRDGDHLAGWWFGDQVGGTQVWARSQSDSLAPPLQGWRIPWDGPITDHVMSLQPLGGPPGIWTPPAPSSLSAGAAVETGGGGGEASSEAAADADAAASAAEAALEEAERAAASVHAMQGASAEELAEAADVLDLQRNSFAKAQKELDAAVSNAKSAAPVVPAAALAQLVRLGPRMRSMQATLMKSADQTRARLSKVHRAEQELQRRSDTDERLQRVEQRDARALQDALPAIIELVSQVEDAVDAAAIMAAPFNDDDQHWEAADDPAIQAQTLQDVEEAVSKAQALLSEAKKLTQQRLQEAKEYALGARKVALQELNALMAKLTAASSKLNPLKRCRLDFDQRREAKKATREVLARLSTVELDVERMHIQAFTPSESQMTEDEVKSIEAQFHPAAGAIDDAQRLLDRRLVAAGGKPAKELQGTCERVAKAKARLDEVRREARRQREGLTAQRLLDAAHDKVGHTEELLVQAREAEAPFLRGIDFLARADALQVASECEAVASRAEAAADQARAFIRAKREGIQARFSKVVLERINTELDELQVRAEAVARQLADFKKEASRRKTAAVLHDAAEKVGEAEAQVQTLAEVVKLFPESLDAASVESLESACGQAAVAEKDASDAYQQARTILSEKQASAREAAMVSAVSQLLQRLSKAQVQLSKERKAAVLGQGLKAAKTVLDQQEEKMKGVEEKVAMAETLATPLGDEQPSDEAVERMGAAVIEAEALLRAAIQSLDEAKAGAISPLKAALAKLILRGKSAGEKLRQVRASTKEQRERGDCGRLAQQARAMVDAAEAALEKVSEAELPFLRGVEVLPKEEADIAIQASEQAAGAVQRAIGEARGFMASKSIEVRTLGAAASKPALEEFAACSERIGAVWQKLTAFRAETEGRRRASLASQAGDQVAALEAAVLEVAAAALADDSMSNDAALEECRKLGALHKGVQAQAEETKRFLAGVEEKLKGHPGHEEPLRVLLRRLKTAENGLAERAGALSESEQRFVAKKLVAEAAGRVDGVEAKLAEAKALAAKLTDDSGATLLAEGLSVVLGTALHEHIKRNSGTTVDALYQRLTGGGKPDQRAFVALMQELSEVPGSEELCTTPDQLESVFRRLDADNDGELSKGEFAALLLPRLACARPVSVTDSAKIESSTTVCKLETGDVVEALEDPVELPLLDVTRLRCRVASTGKEGWVTLKGNQGMHYLEAYSPFGSFSRSIDRCLDSCSRELRQAHDHIRMKGRDLSSASEGPLLRARGELAKLQPRATQAQRRLEDLTALVKEAKGDHNRLEESQKQARQDARDRRVASVALAAISSKVADLESTAQKLQEAAEPMTSAAEPCSEPVSVLEASQRLEAELARARVVVKEIADRYQPELTRSQSSPLDEARRAMAKLMGRVDEAAKSTGTVMAALKAKSHEMGQRGQEKVAALLRTEARRRGTSMGVLFDELAGDGAACVPEEAFVQRVQALPDCDLSPEQALLVCRHVELGGISRRSFLRITQQHLICVKKIGITDLFDISKGKTARLIDVDEVVEVLEGPTRDDSLGITRVRAKALNDGVTGWVTLKGKSGTVFLKDTVKPFLYCVAKVPLEEEELHRDGSAAVRTLKPDEVLEVLEGPREAKIGASLRCRGKACRDGAEGWFTVKDSAGADNATLDTKYLVCLQAVAITDVQDIKACKVVKKLTAGEALRCLEDPFTCPSTGATRVRATSVKDQTEGWVTIKGNQGKVYAKECQAHYAIVRDTPIQTSFLSNAASQIRMLLQGEAVEVTEGPKKETSQPCVRVKGRALSDGAVGWVTMRDDCLQKWSPIYKCVSGTFISETLSVKDSKVVRRLQVGEVIEALEGPSEEPALGILRIRGRCEKDGAVGWITIKGNQGSAFLSCKVR